MSTRTANYLAWGLCALSLTLTILRLYPRTSPQKLEEGRISLRMRLPIVTVLKGDAPYERGYHNNERGLLPSSKTTVEETQEVPAQREDKEQPGRQTKSFRQSRRQCHLVRAVDGMPMEGAAQRLVWGLLQRRPRAFPEVEEGRHIREADEEDGPILR